jgi:hypothetical protein
VTLVFIYKSTALARKWAPSFRRMAFSISRNSRLVTPSIFWRVQLLQHGIKDLVGSLCHPCSEFSK